jgi:pimeloyl-ACP methyl ester carboxylesterase
MLGHLLRWLGPWTPDDAQPVNIRHRTMTLPGPNGGRLRVQVHAPAVAPTRGNLLVAHGLSPHGPYDPRFVRLMRILASAGLCTVAPVLEDFMALRFLPTVTDDLERALDTFGVLAERAPSTRVGLMSISFGSIAALGLLSRRPDSEELGGAVIFGGYGDPEATIRYCAGVREDPALPEPDPLSVAAVAINLREQLGADDTVCNLWSEYARRTWGSPEMLRREHHEPVARELARDLDPTRREVFMRGAGLSADARGAVLAALSEAGVPDGMDPRPLGARIRHPVYLMHGADDDVIPRTQLQVLQRALPASALAGTFVTGLYDHTRTAGVSLAALPALGREGLTLVRMLVALCRAATVRR